MGAVLEVLAFLLTLYMIVLMGRVVFDLIQAFSRGWRPSGFVLVLANHIGDRAVIEQAIARSRPQRPA